MCLSVGSVSIRHVLCFERFITLDLASTEFRILLKVFFCGVGDSLFGVLVWREGAFPVSLAGKVKNDSTIDLPWLLDTEIYM